MLAIGCMAKVDVRDEAAAVLVSRRWCGIRKHNAEIVGPSPQYQIIESLTHEADFRIGCGLIHHGKQLLRGVAMSAPVLLCPHFEGNIFFWD
jgi:hypothetical protein